MTDIKSKKRKCSICGLPHNTVILFMPSNLFVPLCDMCAVDIINNKPGNMAIMDWIKKKKEVKPDNPDE